MANRVLVDEFRRRFSSFGVRVHHVQGRCRLREEVTKRKTAAKLWEMEVLCVKKTSLDKRVLFLENIIQFPIKLIQWQFC